MSGYLLVPIHILASEHGGFYGNIMRHNRLHDYADLRRNFTELNWSDQYAGFNDNTQHYWPQERTRFNRSDMDEVTLPHERNHGLRRGNLLNSWSEEHGGERSRYMQDNWSPQRGRFGGSNVPPSAYPRTGTATARPKQSPAGTINDNEDPLPKNKDIKDRCEQYQRQKHCDDPNCQKLHGEFPCLFHHSPQGQFCKKRACHYSHDPLTHQTRKYLPEYNRASVERDPAYRKLCEHYHKGHCTVGEGCFFMHRDFPCTHYHLSKDGCSFGDDCKFAHEDLSCDAKKVIREKKLGCLQLCRHYGNNGVCKYLPNCRFMHHDYPCCRYFESNDCNFGDRCRFSHYNLSENAKAVLRREVPGIVIQDNDNIGFDDSEGILELCMTYKETGECSGIQNKKCRKMHKEYPCYYFQNKSICVYDKNCWFAHEPLTENGKAVLKNVRKAHLQTKKDKKSPKTIQTTVKIENDMK